MSSTLHVSEPGRTRGMSPVARVYISAVVAAGTLTLAVGAPRTLPEPMLALTFLAAMLVASSFKLRLPLGHGQSTMSMAYVVDFAVLVTLGVETAMVIAAAGVLVQCLMNVRNPQPWYRTAFSVAAVLLALRSAAWTWAALGGGTTVTAIDVVALLAAAVPYFVINSGLVALAIATSNRLSAVRFWQQTLRSTAPGCFLAAAVVGGIQLAMTHNGYLLLALAILPMVVCHVVYDAWFRRIAMREVAAV